MFGLGGPELIIILAVLLVIGLIYLGAAAARKGSEPSSGASAATQAPDALEIARRRFASGEITKEQYEDIIATLTK